MNEGEKGHREWREDREIDIERPDILALVLVLVPVPKVPGLALLVPTALLQFSELLQRLSHAAPWWRMLPNWVHLSCD